VAAAFASTTFVAGVTSGNLGYALRAGFIAAATAGAFYEVGNLTSGGGIVNQIENVAGHAFVGCCLRPLQVEMQRVAYKHVHSRWQFSYRRTCTEGWQIAPIYARVGTVVK
jgi:hypothetical protein